MKNRLIEWKFLPNFETEEEGGQHTALSYCAGEPKTLQILVGSVNFNVSLTWDTLLMGFFHFRPGNIPSEELYFGLIRFASINRIA
jgi:hypothetical protein